MKEFIEKLVKKLENRMSYVNKCHEEFKDSKMAFTYEIQINAYKNVIEIVNKLAEEYKDKYVMRETLNQYMWERDIAISQLNHLGFGFGEKVGWIPCSERLPNEKGEYLITTNFGVTSALYLPNSKKWVDTIEQYYEYSCVAWQPLPKAYKTDF